MGVHHVAEEEPAAELCAAAEQYPRRAVRTVSAAAAVERESSVE